jgi:hypothetical protein
MLCGQVHMLIVQDKTVHSRLQPFKETVSQNHKILRNAVWPGPCAHCLG